MQKSISLFYPYVSRRMRKAANKVLKSKWVGQAHKVDEFELEFGRKFGYPYCVSVNSGSSALELAYELADIKAGDEVIVPVFTCTATNIPLIRRSAKLVFADIDENLTPNSVDIATKITKKTKAIVVVTLGGLPVEDRIFKMAKLHGIKVIIDAAQSLGVGEKYGDYICYSFQAIKHFSTGDGGMLVVRKKDDYKRAKKLRWFGIDREAKRKNNWQPYKNREMIMDIDEPGFKYHMNDIAASMGIEGLKDSDKLLKHREEIALTYNAYLNDKIRIVSGGSYWLYCIITNKRDKVAEHLRKNDIETNVVQLRNDIFKVFGGEPQYLRYMNEIENRYLYLPIHHRVKVKDAIFISKKINEICE